MVILNAANEVAVESFLQGRIGFTHIPELIEQTMNDLPSQTTDDLDQILQDDRRARDRVGALVRSMTGA